MAQTANNSQNDNANQHMKSNLRSMLEKSGYRDIRVAPTAFVIQARDTDGNPVVMSVSPDSFTEVTNLTNNGSATGSAGNGGTAGTFVSVRNSDELGSKVIGLDIYNNPNQDIGQIKDIALNQIGRSQAYMQDIAAQP